MNSINSSIKAGPKVSIGMPVYNGEQTIRKALDSLLAQTFQDFELIISDNASTDSTSEICVEYSKKDKRIRYIHQETNMGASWNFNFVLAEAKYDYFVWAAADDSWHHNFLEKNINILLSEKNAVGSISKVAYQGIRTTNLKSDVGDSSLRNFLRKLSRSLRSATFPISGPYEKKARTYLKSSQCHIFYGIYRTDKLRNSFINETFIGIDWAIVLNALKYGDFHQVDEVLMYRFERGVSYGGIINLSRQFNSGFLGIIFPYYSFTLWCAKNFGLKLFLKNLDRFILLNFEGGLSILVDLILLFKKIITGK